uniref:Kinesin motor domain-containing protein n=1 Tax=Rhizophora mucronata TaxID=61149 RepID=A0A2P2IYR7_RHIMU
MSSTTSRSRRSSISPFRSRKSPAPPAKSAGRPLTPSSSRPPPARPLRLSISPVTSGQRPPGQAFDQPDATKCKENVMVTVRFRSLSAREINKGDEIAWYADGDYTVTNEHNPAIAYRFDRVFGPATTTRHVYDVAAQRVVSGAMRGINGSYLSYTNLFF